MKKYLIVATLAAYSVSLPALAWNIHEQKQGTLVLQDKSPQVKKPVQVEKPVVQNTKKTTPAHVAKKGAKKAKSTKKTNPDSTNK